MKDKKKKVCPVCLGSGILKGECVCDMEWRGSQKGDEWEDCKCTPDQKCNECSGTGTVADTLPG